MRQPCGRFLCDPALHDRPSLAHVTAGMSSTFSIQETLRRDRRSVLYRGIQSEDERPVLLKVLASARPSPRELEMLRHDYELGTVVTRAAVRPIAMTTHDGRSALVMEDFGGIPLDRILGGPMEVEQLSPHCQGDRGRALAQVHAHELIHKGINPEDIFVHPDTYEVSLSGFGIATRLQRELMGVTQLELIEGSLPYMSPEQTGRMNRAVDCRAICTRSASRSTKC